MGEETQIGPAARAGDRGLVRAADLRRVEVGAFNDLGRRRLFVFWRGFEREHGAAYEERRRAEFSVGGLGFRPR